jgi:PhnB protein
MSADSQLQIVPFLVLHDALAAVDFYVKAMGATELFKYTNDGKTMAKVSIGNSVFWVGDEEAEYGNYSPATIGGSPVRMILTTPDPETIFDKAVNSGAIQICPVTLEESWKIGKLRDPYGHIWEIGCPL